MSSASPAPLSSEPSDELLGPASPGSPVPAKRILDRWRQKGSQVGIGQQTALQWWLEPTQRENFPLYRMAIDIFCIPSMSTEAERIFSGAKRQVRWDRSRMSAKMVEACECIKSWISVPKGKSRPLLAGVFREAEDIDAARGYPALALPPNPTIENLSKITWKNRRFVQEDLLARKGAKGRKSWIRSHGTFLVELNYQDLPIGHVWCCN
ncbi:hypothetical protein FPOAC1_007289 [Fusarium poae]|uniref:hypothetical protein n=1 Tax=Fusarium poae TaxID=36050 RepID=UPI001CEABEB6|nr:hypothetical protein FPOAC1_007289 [Fusarium poae]KAG8673970.1 hypothetical protein FPOAC1_007289 [Fusarium poae]